MASSGFRDMTRLALSNLQMAEDMVSLNKKNIMLAIQELKNCANDLLIESYTEQISDIKETRQSMFDMDGKNRYN